MNVYPCCSGDFYFILCCFPCLFLYFCPACVGPIFYVFVITFCLGLCIHSNFGFVHDPLVTFDIANNVLLLFYIS